MSEEKTTPQGKEGEGGEVDLSKYVPVANHIEAKKKLELAEKQLAAFNEAEQKRKEQEMTAEQRAMELEKQNSTLNETLLKTQAKMDDFMNGVRTDLLNKLPEDRQARVKDWDVEQLKTYVDDFTELNAGKGIPGGKPGTTEVGDHGGYNSYTEWAQKDPAGYAKHRQKEGRDNIVWAHGNE